MNSLVAFTCCRILLLVLTVFGCIYLYLKHDRATLSICFYTIFLSFGILQWCMHFTQEKMQQLKKEIKELKLVFQETRNLEYAQSLKLMAKDCIVDSSETLQSNKPKRKEEKKTRLNLAPMRFSLTSYRKIKS